MSESTPGQQAGGSNRILWVVVGVLGAAVVAMGVTLMQMQSRPAAASVAALPAPVPTTISAAEPAAPQQVAPPAVVAAQPQAPVVVAKPQPPVVKKVAVKHPAKAAEQAKPELESATASANPPANAAMPPPPPLKQVCAHCGVVEVVAPIEREAAPTGVGAVAGAVLGGVLGNQVGGGDGKTIATVLGAIGGGYAGNTVEKRMKKVTVYQVDVRMEDGSLQRVEQEHAIAVGTRVTLNGGVINQ